MTQSLTGPRPGYWSGAFEVAGTLPAAIPRTLGDLRITPGFDLRPVGRDRWDELLAQWSLGTIQLDKASSLFISFNDEDTHVVGHLNEMRGACRLSGERAQHLCLNKAELYAHLATRGLPMVNFTVVDSPEALQERLAARRPRDLIAKPSRGSGSRGVLRVRSDRSSDAWVVAQLSLALRDSPVVVMDAIDSADGRPCEWSVEGIVLAGTVVFAVVFEKTSQSRSVPLKDLRMVSLACEPDDSHAQAILGLARRTLELVDAGTSVFHLELRSSGDAFYPIDLGLRPGGGLICEGVLMLCGVDLRVVHALIQLGQFNAVGEYLRLFLRPAVGGVALGACYWDRRRALAPASLPLLASHLASETQSGGFAYHMLCELSSSDLTSSDAGLSLCVHADAPLGALTRLDRIAHALNFS